jgi:hypothetical protein
MDLQTLTEKAQVLLRDVKSKPRKQKLYDILFKHLASNDSVALRRLYSMHLLAADGDITRLNVLSEEEAEAGKEGMRFGDYHKVEGDFLEDCDGCGQHIREVYQIQHSQDDSRSVRLGSTCIYKLAEDLGQFSNLAHFISEDEVIKRKERKHQQLGFKLDVNEGDLKRALSHGYAAKRLAKINEETFKASQRLLALYKLHREMEEDTSTGIDESGVAKALDQGGSRVSWIVKERKAERTPWNITPLVDILESNYAELTAPQREALNFYFFVKQPLHRRGEMANLEDDLRLLRHVTRIKRGTQSLEEYINENQPGLPVPSEDAGRLDWNIEKKIFAYLASVDQDTIDMLHEKAGKVVLPTKVARLFRENVYVTKAESMPAKLIRPDLDKLRVEINRGEIKDIAAVVEVIRPYYEEDKLNWHKNLTSKDFKYKAQFTFEERKAIRNYMFLSDLGGGNSEHNIVRRLSIVDFKNMQDRLTTAGRKIQYKDANNHELRGGKYDLAENFHRRFGIALEDFVDRVECNFTWDKAWQHKAYQFRLLSTYNLYSTDLVIGMKDLIQRAKQVQPYDEIRAGRAREEQGRPLVLEFYGELPDGRKYSNPTQIRHQEAFIEAGKVMDQMEDELGEKLLATLQQRDTFKNARFYSGHIGKHSSLDCTRYDQRSEPVIEFADGAVRILDGTKLADHLAHFTDGYTRKDKLPKDWMDQAKFISGFQGGQLLERLDLGRVGSLAGTNLDSAGNNSYFSNSLVDEITRTYHQLSQAVAIANEVIESGAKELNSGELTDNYQVIVRGTKREFARQFREQVGTTLFFDRSAGYWRGDVMKKFEVADITQKASSMNKQYGLQLRIHVTKIGIP